MSHPLRGRCVPSAIGSRESETVGLVLLLEAQQINSTMFFDTAIQ